MIDIEKYWVGQAELAEDNREAFLAPYRKKFDETEPMSRQRADIVIELIKKAPSHLKEPWILDEVIRWLRKNDCREFLEEAFLSQEDPTRHTEEETRQISRELALIQEVDEIMATRVKSVLGACEYLVNKNLTALLRNRRTVNPAAVLARQYHRCKSKHLRLAKTMKRKLPFPYWGEDIC